MKKLKYACYFSLVTLSVVSTLSPVLMMTFRGLYGLSFTRLGFLVLVNFCTQLGVDLVFSFFSHLFDIQKSLRAMPCFAAAGLLVYGIWPFFFPSNVYTGLLLGTVLFAAAGGLCEVLVNPVFAAIPSNDPDRELSRMHSVFAWGVVFVVAIITSFLFLFGEENWQILPLIFMIFPLVSSLLFFTSKIPPMPEDEKGTGAVFLLKKGGVWLCVLLIFFGGAAECTMEQWASGYLEAALGISKVWGDLFGVALFSAMLGFGRSLYGKIGRNIYRVLTLGFLGAFCCYVIASLSSVPLFGLFACAFCGFCTSMLWPGSLLAASDRFPEGGVVIYALMASGGDLGASVGPQLVGSVTDLVMACPTVSLLAEKHLLSPEQIGMKAGMLLGALFPLAGIFLSVIIRKKAKSKGENE